MLLLPLGPVILSFVERLSSFRGDFLYRVHVYTSVLLACPLLGGLSSFGHFWDQPFCPL